MRKQPFYGQKLEVFNVYNLRTKQIVLFPEDAPESEWKPEEMTLDDFRHLILWEMAGGATYRLNLSEEELSRDLHLLAHMSSVRDAAPLLRKYCDLEPVPIDKDKKEY